MRRRKFEKVAEKKKSKVAAKKDVKVQEEEKLLGVVDHFFGRISVVAFKVKAPFEVGDTIHIKGHTTDFTQQVNSMQMNLKDIRRAKKGDEVGIKVKEKARTGDAVYLAAPSVLPPPPRQTDKPDPYSDIKFLKF